MEDFSTFQVAAETYRFLGRSFGAFLRRAFLAVLAAAGVIYLAVADALQIAETPSGILIALAAFAVLLAAHFAVGWHRYVLRPELPRAYGWRRLRLTLSYLWTMLLLAVIVSLPPLAAVLFIILFGPALTVPSALLALFLSLTLAGKLAFALPAAAIGRDDPLRQSWAMSSGLTPQVVLVLLLTGGVLDLIAVLLIGGGLSLALPPAGAGALAVAVPALILLGAAAAATGLSLAYRWRARWDDSAWWSMQ